MVIAVSPVTVMTESGRYSYWSGYFGHNVAYRKIGIGMGYVEARNNTETCIDMRGRKLKAVVVRPPSFRGKV